MDHWTDLPSENHWKHVSFTYIAIYTPCSYISKLGAHTRFLFHLTPLFCDFEDFLPDWSVIFLWNNLKNLDCLHCDFGLSQAYGLGHFCTETKKGQKDRDKKKKKEKMNQLLSFSQNHGVQVLRTAQKMHSNSHVKVYFSKISSSIFGEKSFWCNCNFFTSFLDEHHGVYIKHII